MHGKESMCTKMPLRVFAELLCRELLWTRCGNTNFTLAVYTTVPVPLFIGVLLMCNSACEWWHSLCKFMHLPAFVIDIFDLLDLFIPVKWRWAVWSRQQEPLPGREPTRRLWCAPSPAAKNGYAYQTSSSTSRSVDPVIQKTKSACNSARLEQCSYHTSGDVPAVFMN